MVWLNFFVLGYIGAMAYWWALQGVFSSFLHLVMVIVAGSLALAIWEPLVIGLLAHHSPQWAWGVGLILPFALLLFLIRKVTDHLVPKNMVFQNLIGNAGGGTLGVFSAILTAGLTIIGIGFTPVRSDLIGYEPYLIGAKGQLEPNNKLWLPVDQITHRFFSSLSAGSFYPMGGKPLAIYQPDLPLQSAIYRIRYDPHSSVGVVPGSIDVDKVYTTLVNNLEASFADALAETTTGQANQLVAVDTLWRKERGTFDRDLLLRVPPTQIRLITRSDENKQMRFHPPVAYSHVQDHQSGDRLFQPINSPTVSAYGVDKTERFAWVFLIPSEQQPCFLWVRQMRFKLPEKDQLITDLEQVKMVIGVMPTTETASGSDSLANGDTQGPTRIGPRVGPLMGHRALPVIENSNVLPQSFSRNFAHGFTYDGLCILEGTGKASRRKGGGGPSRRVMINCIHVSKLEGMVRLQLQRQQAQSFLGGTMVAAARVGGVWLVDEREQKHFPIAYVWNRKSEGEQQISVDRNAPIRSAAQLPVARMRDNDELYLYFPIKKGIKIVEYGLGGGQTTQEINPPLEVE